MTRLKKLFATMLLVLVTVCSVLGSAVLNIARSIFTSSSAKADVVSIPGNQNDTDEVQAGSVVSIPGFLTKVEKNNSITLPMSSVKVNGVNLGDGLVNLFVEVTDIYGQALTQYDDAEGTQVVANMGEQVAITGAAAAKELVLTPKKAGIYNVKYYVLSNGIWTSTNTYNIRVAEESYKMVFEGNGATVMPSTFNYTQEQDISIALPLLYDENGYLIENKDILLGSKQGTGADAYYYVIRYEDVAGAEGVKLNAVSKINDTTNTYTEYKTYTVKKVASATVADDIEYALYVDLHSANLNMSNHDTSAEGTQLLTLSGVTADAAAYDKTPYAFHVTSALVGGEYVLTYNLHKVDAGTPAPTASTYLNYAMTGDTDFDQSNIKVYAKPASNVKRSDVSYGEKHYLPSVNASNASDANTTVEAFYYYSIGVESGDDLVYAADKVVLGHDENGFYFIPKTSGATYEFDYKTVDAFGNTSDTTSTDNYYTIQIYDDSNPIAVYTSAFDTETVDQTNPETIAELEDISYVIPTKYAISSDTETKTIRIPALAASDYSGLREVSRQLSSTSFIVDANGTLASSTQYLYITSNTGAPSAPSKVTHVELRDYLKFQDVLGRLIDADGYLIDVNGDYIDGQGNPVAEANKVFAFKDGEGHDLTGTALRDAFNACEAIITLRKDVFAAGTYTLTMRAQDTGNKYNSNRDTTITLVDYDDMEETTPTVKYNEFKVSSVVDNQDVYIAIPTVKDDADKNLLVKYYVDVEGAAELIEVNTDEDGKYIKFNTSERDSAAASIFELAAASSTKSFKVVTFAFNDYALTASELISETGTNLLAEALQQYDATDDTFAHIGYAEYKVNIKSYASDAIPTITTLPTIATMVAPTQYKDYAVDGFVFKDDTDTARVQVSITDTKGNSYDYSTNGAMTIVEENDEFIYTFPGITFHPSNADDGNEYTVTYRVVDDAKNTVSYSFVLIHAVNREIPAISGISGEEATLELGESYVFQGVEFSNAQTVKVTAKNSAGKDVSHWINPSSYTFSPEEAGTYTITFIAINGTLDSDPTAPPKDFKITVADTKAPILEYVEAIASGDSVLVPESAITTENSVTTYPNVKLPTVRAQDQWSANAVEGLVADTTTVSIKISTPSGDTYTLDALGNLPDGVENTLNVVKTGDFLYFTPTARGTYTITYSAQDAAGNQATSKVVTVKVGDTEKPTIELTNAFKDKLEKGFVIGKNDTLTINNNAIVNATADDTRCDIRVSDNYGFNSTHDATLDVDIQKVTVSITNANGSTITPESADELLQYTFTTSGTYTLKLTVSDKLGNQRVYTKQFYVTTQESTQSDASTIVGIALIVASALVLAGVIVYFVRGTKMLPKKKANKQSKKED